VELGQTHVALSFGPALRPNSSRAALKALGQEIWALHYYIILQREFMFCVYIFVY